MSARPSSSVVPVFAALALLAAAPPARPAAPDPPAPRSGVVCGTVLDAGGAPLPGSARAELRDGAATEPAASAAAGPDGRFCLEAGDGASAPMTVTVTADGHLPMSRRVGLAGPERPSGAAGPVELPPVRLPPATGVVLELRGAGGEPAADVPVRAVSAGPEADDGWRPPERAGRTDAAGRVVLSRAPGEELEVVASAGTSIHRAVTLPADPARPDAPPPVLTAPLGPIDSDDDANAHDGAGAGGVRALLPAGRAVYGRVLDERRRPLPEAEVMLRAAGGREATVVTTGADGRFLALAAPAPRFDLRADAPGFAPSELPGMTLPPGHGAADLGTLELQPGVAVAGRVTDAAGEPLPGAELRHREVSGLPSRRQKVLLLREPPAAVSGAGGTFTIPDLPAGRPLHLLASRAGYLATWILGVEAPPREPVEIALERAAAVAGTLVDGEGEPVADGRVLVTWPGPPPGTVGVERRRGDGFRSVTTGGDGAFRFEDLDPGAVELSAEAGDFLPSERETVELAPGEDREGVVLVVRRGAVIRGRALDSRGEPVAGAEVRTGRTSTTTSGEDGSFRLAGLPVGFAGLFGFHPDFRRAVEEVEVRPGVNEVDLRFEDGFVLAGRTVDAAGEPLPGVRLVARQESIRQVPGYPATSDADGRFRIVVSEEGRFGLMATRAGYAPATLSGLEAGPAPLEDLEVTLSAGASIMGTIYGLELDDLATVEMEARAEGIGTVAGTVDYLGEYAVHHLLPGDWRVRAQVEGGRREARATVVVPEGEARVVRDLELGAGVAFSGRVRYREEPVAAAHVALDGRDVAAHRSVITGHDGGFRIDDLEPGRYRLDVLDPSRALSHLREVEITGDRVVEIDLVSERLSGRVVEDETGEPIVDALVYVQSVGGPGGEEGALVTVGTDAAGGFVLAHVAPGSYRVSARKDGYTPHEAAVRVEAGAETPPTLLRLAGAGGLTLTVRLESGQAPHFVTVSAFDGSGRKLQTETESVTGKGHTYFGQLPAGTWNLLIDARGAAAEWATARVPGVLEVVLPPAAPLAVRVPALIESGGAGTVEVASQGGEPFFEVEPNGTIRSAWPLENGLATVPDLPAGAWTVRVTSAGGEVWSGSASTDGRAPAQLTLE